MHLSADGEDVLFVECQSIGIHAGGRLEGCQSQLHATIGNTVPQTLQHTPLIKIPRDILNRLLETFFSVIDWHVIQPPIRNTG
jgi:hypothetical protein